MLCSAKTVRVVLYIIKKTILWEYAIIKKIFAGLEIAILVKNKCVKGEFLPKNKKRSKSMFESDINAILSSIKTKDELFNIEN